MTVFGGLQSPAACAGYDPDRPVSIPMTVFGGLQCRYFRIYSLTASCFNTDDGIWRATISIMLGEGWPPYAVSIPMTVFGGLQYCNDLCKRRNGLGFNTDDGIWRATILFSCGIGSSK